MATLETPPSGALGAFLFQKSGSNGAFRSIASARSFPIVGQVVGQLLRIRLLKVKLILRYPENKIVLYFYPGYPGPVDIDVYHSGLRNTSEPLSQKLRYCKQ